MANGATELLDTFYPWPKPYIEKEQLMSIYLKEDEDIVEEAVTALMVHPLAPQELPHTSEEDDRLTSALELFFEHWATEKDFFHGESTLPKEVRMDYLIEDFVCRVFEVLRI
jgi:hypothetical protein